MQEWNIDKGSKACSQCAVPFGSETPYVGALFEQAEGFARRDFCVPCWEKGVPAAFSYWKTQTEKKEEKRDDRRTLTDLWENLSGSTAELEGQRLKMAFLIAMSLVRKRVLRMDPPIQRDNRELLVLTRPSDQRVFTLPHPDISEDELQPLYEELSRLLGLQA